MNARDAWSATLGQLQVQLNRSTFDTWLRHADLFGYEDGRFVVTVPNAYAKDWIERHLLDSMTHTLTRIFRRPCEIQIIVWNPVEADEDAGGPLLTHPAQPKAGIADDTALNPRNTLDSFVMGDSNRYAALLARAIVDSPIGKYSPVLFYGEMGMGKTHLLQGITHALRAARLNVVYLTAEEFTADLITAIRGQAMPQFRERFRNADAVLIDDLQFVEGKDNTQNELVAIWDALRNRQRAILFASDRLPRDMGKLSQDARSRFQAGPIAKLDAPDFDLRCAIVDSGSRERGLLLSPDVRESIAERVVTNVRDLLSAVEQLHTYHQLTRQPITLETARTLLAALGSTIPERGPVTLERVLEATARFYRLTPGDLASRKRTKAVIQARQMAMYLAREEAGGSLQQIGAALGGRDHSTVLHGVTKISQSLTTDTALMQDLRAIRDLLMREPDLAPVPGERKTRRA